MIYRFKTRDCPDANNRTPEIGEQKWTIDFPTSEGGRIYIEMGKESRDAFKAMLAQDEIDE